jgi:hypothetical protein
MEKGSLSDSSCLSKQLALKGNLSQNRKKAEYTPPEEQSVSLQQNREAAANCHEFKIVLYAKYRRLRNPQSTK